MEAKKVGTFTDQLETLYNTDIERKKEANVAKEKYKIRSESHPTFMSATVDLQSVLQIPSSKESLLYYCGKLCIYNCTIYKSKLPNEAWCGLK